MERKEFLYEYRMNGKRYGGGIYARDWKEAEGRLDAIARSGKIVGKLVERIPAYPSVATYGKFLCWWYNLKNRIKSLE